MGGGGWEGPVFRAFCCMAAKFSVYCTRCGGPLLPPVGSPCNRALALSLNTSFREKVEALFNEVLNSRAGNAENGWIKTSDGMYFAPSERSASSMKYDYAALKGKKIQEGYHSHPAGACYPSWADLRALCTWYKNGMIDVDAFSYGVVTGMGCLSLVITSETDFQKFVDGVLDGSVKRKYDNMRGASMSNGVGGAVAKFIDFLKNAQAGINVLFNETVYDIEDDTMKLGNWTAKDSNGQAVISDYNCN